MWAKGAGATAGASAESDEELNASVAAEPELAEPERFYPDIFEVDAIASKRKSGRGYQYLIKWKDYKEEDNTWEAASKVEKTAKELVDAQSWRFNC